MVTAKWNGSILAQSDNCKVVEGNYYFPPEAIKHEHFIKSDTTTVCSWKGTASYYDINANGTINKDAAWYYPHPKDAAKNIEGYVAFWKGVEVDPH